ncbi:hypothetical protein N7507_006530 [Penicillium longicatenatum]|nr:hypothetical protein N7507_006530 [Penicillium longicatenatum]
MVVDPPAGGSETPPTNTQETTASFIKEDLEPRTATKNQERTRSGDAFAQSNPAGRISTKGGD